MSFGLTEMRAMGRRTVRVTLECAGNGRAALQPRPISQPWLTEAVGTAEWTGVPLSDLLRAAGIREDAVDVVFTGADHGVERGVEQDYQRGLIVTEAIDSGAIVAWEMNGQPLPPQHGYPLRLVVPGLVRDGEREVAAVDRADRPRVRRVPERGRVPDPHRTRTIPAKRSPGSSRGRC